MNTTNETTTSEVTQAPVVQKWEAKDIGPRMLKQFNDALRAANFNSRGVATIHGIIGKPETERGRDMVMVAMFGGAINPAYNGKMAEIQADLGHVVTADNYKAITSRLQELAAWLHQNPIIEDKRETQEEHDAKEANYKAAMAKQDAEQRAKEEARGLALEKYRKTYPWAKQDGSSWARGAANLRQLLALKFPGVDFSVKSDSYAGGCSIRLRWVMGPTSAEVRAISGQFQEKQFDGSQDLETYREDNRAFTQWMGGAGYVFENRDCNAECGHLRELLEQAGGSKWAESGFHSLQDTTYRLMESTSFPAGAKITGVEVLPEPREGVTGFEAYYRVLFETSTVPQAEPVAPVTGETGIIAKLNAEKGGVEIKFPGKPAQSVIDNVKAHGFRWSRFSGVWWAKDRPAAREFAFGLAGAEAPTEAAHVPAESVRDPGEDAADRWAEMQHGLACNT